MKIKFLIASIFLLTFITISCEKEDTEPADEGYASGLVITNEGAFGNNNGSVSLYCRDSAKVTNNLFEKVNGRNPGDVVQSFGFEQDKGVIVVNNSQKIEIVDLETFESTGTITGLSYPRYFKGLGNGTGYLTNGNEEGEVYLLNLQQAEVTDTVEVGMGPEQMERSGDYVFVANSGGWDFDNTVSVININDHSVEKEIELGDVPYSVVSDANENIWVLCRGKLVYDDSYTEIIEETNSKLVKINGSTLEVEETIVIGEKGDGFQPSFLTVCPSGMELYFDDIDGLYKMDTGANSQPSTPLIERGFSNVWIEPDTGDIFALTIPDYSSAGQLRIYDSEGREVNTHDLGIGPNGLFFQ